MSDSSAIPTRSRPVDSKVILLTGASSGFGRLTVPMLLDQGHIVIAGIRGGQERLAKVLGPELKLHPGRLHAADLHLDRPETFDVAFAYVRDHFGGKLDVLVNNAGIGLFGALEEQTPAQFKHEFEVNFVGPAMLTRRLLPALRAAHGRVINVSSVCGLVTLPGYTSYCATKHALEALSEGLHYELKPHGVQVALVEPGGFRTEFTGNSKVLGDGVKDPASPYRKRTLALDEFFAKSSARLGDPKRVARLIARLCEKEHVALRNPIGMDAQFMKVFRAALPDSWRARILEFTFRKVVYRD